MTDPEPFERNKQFDLDFYRSHDGYSSSAKDFNIEVEALAKKVAKKASTKPTSIVKDPEIRSFLTKELEEEKSKEVDVGFCFQYTMDDFEVR